MSRACFPSDELGAGKLELLPDTKAFQIQESVK